MLTNPIKRIRAENSLTQQQLATQCNVTRQVILKSEQGLYGMIPPKVLAPVAELSNIPEKLIESTYREFQRETRFENRGLILDKLGKFSEIDGESYKEFRVKIGSVAGLCKLLCVHNSQWDRLENRGGNDGFFRTALVDGEIEWLANSLYL